MAASLSIKWGFMLRALWFSSTQDGDPHGSRVSGLVYAIGDIHGRLDLLDVLLSNIEEDCRAFEEKPTVVLLGDYIDRGPASRQVIDRIVSLMSEDWCDVVALMGNHEDALIRFVRTGADGAKWCEHGGIATLASYNIFLPSAQLHAINWDEVADNLWREMPATHKTFFERLDTVFVLEDYLFVHAGVMPDKDVWQQGNDTLLWIRQPFLSSPKPNDRVVVHGHTPVEEPENLRWRVNVDTGAYATNVLTAARLIGSDRHFIQARLNSTYR